MKPGIKMFEPGNSRYINSLNLRARFFLHYKFSSNRYSWPLWVFDNIAKKCNAKILEIGCGNGIFWKVNESRIPENWEITLTDPSASQLKNAKNMIGQTLKNFKFEVMSADNLSYDDETFDIIIANQILFFVDNRKKTISEIRRVLKNNGIFYTTTMEGEYMRELEDLVAEYRSNLSGKGCKYLIKNFSLQNGEEQLREFFDEVELKIYNNFLVITEASPFADFAVSLNNIYPGKVVVHHRERNLFAEFIKKKIDKEGSITIAARSGMFINKNI